MRDSLGAMNYAAAARKSARAELRAAKCGWFCFLMTLGLIVFMTGIQVGMAAAR